MGTPKERTMFSVMMENLKESGVIVKVTCENDDAPPGGMKLLYNHRNDTFHILVVSREPLEPYPFGGSGFRKNVGALGEAWCQQSAVAHSGDVGSFSEARAASDIERKGWSFSDGKLLCPHCTKRKTNGGE